MKLGYRIIRPHDVGSYPLAFVQISLWRIANWGVADGERGVKEAIDMAGECRRRGIRTVFHPLEYPLSNEHEGRTLDVMRRLAAASDLGIIIHDEGGRDGQRLSTVEADRYEKKVKEIGALCPVSIENSYNSGDITWFWERFVLPAADSVSITLDIGHLELAGINSTAFVRNMPDRLVERMKFVHMHHHNEAELGGVKDHWPLEPGCREIEALKALLERKQDLRVILELDAREGGLQRSVELLQNL